MRGAPASAHSFSKMNRCTGPQPGPPHSRGQCVASQPRSANVACQPAMSSRVRRNPSRTLCASAGDNRSRKKARTSSWKAVSWGVSRKSISIPSS